VNLVPASTRVCCAIARFTLLLTTLCYLVVADAAPRVPQDDREVLERLPTVIGGALRELRPLRKMVSADPSNLALATELARRYVAIGRAESDPRYFGYAEAALEPWFNQDLPPAEVLLLRAILHQQRHDFDRALADLGTLLRRDPHNAQAWLIRGGILQIRGDIPQAILHCAAVLSQPRYRFAATTCLCKSLSLGGHAEEGYLLLRRALEDTPGAPAAERSWAWTLLAEMAQRRGQIDQAEEHFQSALRIGLRDRYLLMSYADFLLDRGQADKVRMLLTDETRVDSLLLRLSLAEQELGMKPKAHIASLEARFGASRQRGDSAHHGEEARLRLHLLGQPAEALQLAQGNWMTQREPRDARILLESALAARDPKPAAPVLAFMQQSGLEDVQLAPLAEAIRALPP
jgi:tetratricopeptide (TPR) repeat protein